MGCDVDVLGVEMGLVALVVEVAVAVRGIGFCFGAEVDKLLDWAEPVAVAVTGWRKATCCAGNWGGSEALAWLLVLLAAGIGAPCAIKAGEEFAELVGRWEAHDDGRGRASSFCC